MSTRSVKQVWSYLNLALLLALTTCALGNSPPEPVYASLLPPALHSMTEPIASNALLEFTSRGQALGFGTGGFYLSDGSYALQVELVNARPMAPMSDEGRPEGFRGHPSLTQVSYANLWPGITLSYDGSGGLVRSSYRVEPHADPSEIQLRYNAPVALNADGSLTIAFATGQIIESAPTAWQDIADARLPVHIGFELHGVSEIGFVIGAYDAERPLFIDLALTWNTFLGGSGNDRSRAIALDADKNVYVLGDSSDTWGSPIRAFEGGENDAFVAKLGPNGNLVWNTFLGGGEFDSGSAIALDSIGNIYVSGYSTGTWGSPMRDYNCGDAFVAKLSPSGDLLWNTFLGGLGFDSASGIAVDGNGDAFILGFSNESWGSPIRDFTAFPSSGDSFVAKLSSAGVLSWNTFLGGGGGDDGMGIALAQNGDIDVVGYSDATWGEPLRGFGGFYDVFIARLSADGTLQWNTFLGGTGYDYGFATAVDNDGNLYVAGYSSDSWGVPVREHSIGMDAFASKLDSHGVLLWNTFLGGSGSDRANAIALDGNGNVYVAGYSDTAWGPSFRPYSSGWDGYVAKLDSNGALMGNSFWGGDGDDWAYAVAVDPDRNVYVSGYSDATWGSPLGEYAGYNDAFVVRIEPMELQINFLPFLRK